jgi:hypothetical protein
MVESRTVLALATLADGDTICATHWPVLETSAKYLDATSLAACVLAALIESTLFRESAARPLP